MVRNEFPASEVEKPVDGAFIAILDEHATECFGGEFVFVMVLEAGVGCAAKYLNMSEVTGETNGKGVWNTARTCGCNRRG
jgi:hypothetical protein